MITVASYRSKRRRRHQFVEEVPGLYIRRLTLEDPKTARERPESGLQLGSRHVCHPRASYVPPSAPVTSSYRSWLEQIRREHQAVLTIISLELPECPVPLIEFQANKRCRTANNQDAEETINEIFAKVAESRKRIFKNSNINEKSEEESDGSVDENYGIEQYYQENQSFEGTFSEMPIYDEDDDDDNDDNDKKENEENENSNNGEDSSKNEIITKSNFEDCMCTEISEKLRINIRKKTEVTTNGRKSVGCCSSRSSSPEVTHTIRIAMKCHGQHEMPTREHSNSHRKSVTSTKSIESTDDDKDLIKSCCPGVSVALDFTLNCNSVQLTSRDVTVRPIIAPTNQTIGKCFKNTKELTNSL